MDKECPTKNFSGFSEDEKTAFLKVFNFCLNGDKDSKSCFPTGADYKVFITKTW